MRVPLLVVQRGPPAASRAPSMPWMMPYPSPPGASAPGAAMLAGVLRTAAAANAWTADSHMVYFVLISISDVKTLLELNVRSDASLANTSALLTDRPFHLLM